MIWQFEELGYDFSIDYNGRVGNKPIRWDYLNNIERNNLFKTFSALNFLKQNYETFSTTNFSLSTSSATKKIQLTHESMNAIIIGNFDVVEKSIIPDFQNTGKWYNYFSSDSIEISNTQASITLKPGEFHIYTTVKLPTPEQGILVDIQNEEDKILPHFELLQNFPNPFNPETIIQYSIPPTEKVATSNVKIVVFDVLGREVKTLVSQDQKPGNYEIKFNAKELSSGIYYYKLSYGSFSKMKKMVFLK